MNDETMYNDGDTDEQLTTNQTEDDMNTEPENTTETPTPEKKISPELRHEILKALRNYEIRKAANERWRARNPERVKAIRSEYNKKKNSREKTLRQLAKELGMM